MCKPQLFLVNYAFIPVAEFAMDFPAPFNEGQYSMLL